MSRHFRKKRSSVQPDNRPLSSGVSKNYLRASAHDSSEEQATICGEKYPMHCIAIHDLLQLDKLYDHATLKAMGKLVIPEIDDVRPTIFISHQ
eukprot:gene14-554_t